MLATSKQRPRQGKDPDPHLSKGELVNAQHWPRKSPALLPVSLAGPLSNDSKPTLNRPTSSRPVSVLPLSELALWPLRSAVRKVSDLYSITVSLQCSVLEREREMGGRAREGERGRE